jgi:hypothetical protein
MQEKRMDKVFCKHRVDGCCDLVTMDSRYGRCATDSGKLVCCRYREVTGLFCEGYYPSEMGNALLMRARVVQLAKLWEDALHNGAKEKRHG